MLYSQSKGVFSTDDGEVLVTGCEAGNDSMGKDLNNPESQFIHSRGPLPQGIYSIGALLKSAAVKSWSCFLTPDTANNMGNPPRGGFFIHLRNVQHLAPDGTNASSDGCITTASYADLEKIANYAANGDSKLTVVG